MYIHVTVSWDSIGRVLEKINNNNGLTCTIHGVEKIGNSDDPILYVVEVAAVRSKLTVL